MDGAWGWRPYVSVSERRSKAEREVARLLKKGRTVSPVIIEGTAIARTFWGKAWCRNLESYSDFANRLPRGRTYARNGSVIDLQIARGQVEALVSGTEVYRVAVEVTPVPAGRWSSLCSACAGAIDSLVELLQGRFSKGVMERICRPGTGLFPAPGEIRFSCTCPDWASLCKHVAATLYGVGARLDEQPELLFRLRGVDEKDLIAKAGQGLTLTRSAPREGRVLPSEGLAELFGLDLGTLPASVPGEAVRASKPTTRKVAKRPKAGTRKTAPKAKKRRRRKRRAA